eukprot:TRINITY_DN3203_c0_g1_i1.p1 TRINITY_DN3203_c0_g1~~TRINITY_DN3203_c0_g1_i1.p1  ORF type:complete len:439 (-),score=110.16 TRINITY_DN3203_c0_g1_i1:100-1416(-)
MLDSSYVVSGSRRGLKKSKPFFLPEIYVENEEGVRHRSGSLVKHSTPNLGIRSIEPRPSKKPLEMNTTADSGYDEWSVNESSYSSDCSHNSSYKTPTAKQAEASLWDSFVTPIQDLRQHFKSRPSFVEERTKVKFNVETLVTVCLGVVMFSSIVFSVYMGANLVASPNGKLRAIKYGSNKKLQNMRKEGRLIDYDIKDETGNVLGGKRAAIQFAYDQKYGRKDNSAKRPTKANIRKRASPPDPPKVVKVKVEDPVPTVKDEQELSIAELSKKIDELNALLQSDLEVAVSQLDINEKIASMQDRKKSLIKKIKPKNSVKGGVGAKPVAGTVDPESPEEESTGEATPEAVETDKSVNKDGETKAKKSRKTKAIPVSKEMEEAPVSVEDPGDDLVGDEPADVPADDLSGDVDHPGSEDLGDPDPGLLDYPDDPHFRGKEGD